MKLSRRVPAIGIGGNVVVLLIMLLMAAPAETLTKGNPVVEPTAPKAASTGVLADWPKGRGAYPRCEAAVRLPSVRGNPFAAAVWGDVELPDGCMVRIPAFFDGDHVWKIRFTPMMRGVYRVTGFLAGEKRGTARPLSFETLGPVEFEVEGNPTHGFVRSSPIRTQQFVFDDGTVYFPFGQNLGWVQVDQYPTLFKKYADAGLNWSRVWMAHWTHQNLDWESPGPASSGTLNLDAARAWDRIVEAAEVNGIRIQVVLQHHGQYSTFVNPNWKDNPWNAANGGFLKRPEDFFTDATARRLTRRKYRHIVARWGYSPAVMSWELFNEVEFTDGYLGHDLVDVWQAYEAAGRVDADVVKKASSALAKLAKRPGGAGFTLADVESALKDIEHGVFPGFEIGFGVGVVAAWHREMAEYIRGIDPFNHLITTSSVPVDSPVWEAMDYYQFHSYRRNMVEAVSRLPRDVGEFNRPVFYGEIGDHEIKDPAKADGRYMRTMVWASLFSGAAGTAQMWAWDRVDRLNFYSTDRAIRRFIDAAGYGTRPLRPVDIAFQTTFAESTDPAPAVLAVGDDEGLALWIYQDRAVHEDPPPGFEGRLFLPELFRGRCRVEWWDTRKGEVLSTETLEAEGNPAPSIPTPIIHGDLAALLSRIDSTENSPVQKGPRTWR